MMRKKSIKSETTHNGTLNTPVAFYSTKVASGLHKRGTTNQVEYKAWAEIYNSSLKDIEILKSRGVKKSVTIKIRNPYGAYETDNKHVVEIHAPSYQGVIWKIEDIRPKNGYITFLLNGDNDGA
ncbi:phage head-tail adapter protein [Streptococcus gallolyticus]|uniref:phage head-tail adapter protein n=1 Tax=Streptococcus gallolyticus TaxID=315405 RepID=UPI000E409ECE|nr:phage head-tail adapter protein [Streptococcus gallolyticus]RGC38211.1 phage head-tail adapter protein [Streptococcus gallolyticus]